jgi:GTP pyrophosphokinase
MHQHAEHGVAAHWAYKEAGVKGYAGVSASSPYEAKIAVLRQLLAWERDIAGGEAEGGPDAPALDDRIYVLTPDAAVVELVQGATAVDFAYSVHTNVGHRCRGARVDGHLVPLSTPLRNGQTVDIITAKEGGPSRDWLNVELGFLNSQRARAKVRAWFNAQALTETVAKGREAVEKLLQREGRTAIRLEDLASQLGFKSAEDLFAVVGTDEFSLRTIEALFRPAAAPVPQDEFLLKKPRATSATTFMSVTAPLAAAPARPAALTAPPARILRRASSSSRDACRLAVSTPAELSAASARKSLLSACEASAWMT